MLFCFCGVFGFVALVLDCRLIDCLVVARPGVGFDCDFVICFDFGFG